jgi:Transposase
MSARICMARYWPYFSTNGVSNGGTEAINLLIEKTRRLAHGYRNFDNYRLRILLVADGSRPYRERPDHVSSEKPVKDVQPLPVQRVKRMSDDDETPIVTGRGGSMPPPSGYPAAAWPWSLACRSPPGDTGRGRYRPVFNRS